MTTYNYAQIDQENTCIAISALTGNIQAENLIPIPTYDESLLGKTYTPEGTWQDPPEPEPEPEPEEPQQTNEETPETKPTTETPEPTENAEPTEPQPTPYTNVCKILDIL